MKTPDEIKKGLFCCWEDGCTTCPYDDDCTISENFMDVARDALTYIQQLEYRLAQVERERDAALHDINRCCGTCKHFQNEEDDCTAEECIGSYMEPSCWEWRGVCEENTKCDADA